MCGSGSVGVGARCLDKIGGMVFVHDMVHDTGYDGSCFGIAFV
jgi:hypothetical protein